MTEDEARQKWCPMWRDQVTPEGPGLNINGKCQGSKCMMWRWLWTQAHIDHVNAHNEAATEGQETYPTPPDAPQGYCGLAGKPHA